MSQFVHQDAHRVILSILCGTMQGCFPSCIGRIYVRSKLLHQNADRFALVIRCSRMESRAATRTRRTARRAVRPSPRLFVAPSSRWVEEDSSAFMAMLIGRTYAEFLRETHILQHGMCIGMASGFRKERIADTIGRCRPITRSGTESCVAIPTEDSSAFIVCEVKTIVEYV